MRGGGRGGMRAEERGKKRKARVVIISCAFFASEICVRSVSQVHHANNLISSC